MTDRSLYRKVTKLGDTIRRLNTLLTERDLEIRYLIELINIADENTRIGYGECPICYGKTYKVNMILKIDHKPDCRWQEAIKGLWL